MSTSERVARATRDEVMRQLAGLPREEIARRSIVERGAIVLARGLSQAVRLADQFAPEHLVLLVKDAARLVPRLSRAGAVFVGSRTPEAIGDYVAGPSHVLPTAGTARFASPLSVATFRRRMSVVEMSERSLAALAPVVEALAAAEGLEAHARAVRIRLPEPKARRRARRG